MNSENGLPTHQNRSRSSTRRRHSKSPLSRFIRRVKHNFNWRGLIVLGLSGIILMVVVSLALLTDSFNRVNASVNNLNRLLQNLKTRPSNELTLKDFERLQETVNSLGASIKRAQVQTAILKPLAWVNSDVQSAFVLLTVANHMSNAVDDILTGLSPTLFFLVEGQADNNITAQLSSGERIVELLEIGRPRFLEAQQALSMARSQLEQLNLTQVSSNLLTNILDLSVYYDEFQAIDSLLLVAPQTLSQAFGMEQDQNYLILSQNSDELRPSGGYISTYGWMTVRNGRISNYDYLATTATSPVPPQTAIPFNIPYWWIQYRNPIYAAWDGSWYADFTRTAEMALWYYNTGSNPNTPIQGVIAIDLTGFHRILEVIGEVTVPEFQTTVTAENFRQTIYDIRAFGKGEQPHKQFVAAIFRAIFAEWQTLSRDSEKSVALLGVILQALQEKHIMLYFSDMQLTQTLDSLNWDGRQTPATSHDYVLIADANLGNKSNSSVQRQQTYDVSINSDGTLESHLAVNYDYADVLAKDDPAIDPAYHGQLNYNNLLQIFVPVGANLISSQTTVTQAIPTETHTIFVDNLTVLYDTSERYTWYYTSPRLIDIWGKYRRYRLLLQKQPGTQGDFVTVQVTMPLQANVLRTSPVPAASYNLENSVLEFRLNLTTDQWIEILYSQ